MQEKVWNRGMQKSKGMLGGTFAFSQVQRNDFLVLTGWKSEDHHQNYKENKFPELSKPQNLRGMYLNLRENNSKLKIHGVSVQKTSKRKGAVAEIVAAPPSYLSSSAIGQQQPGLIRYKTYSVSSSHIKIYAWKDSETQQVNTQI
jgi:heme-degrading monooxygenase HmoA